MSYKGRHGARFDIMLILDNQCETIETGRELDGKLKKGSSEAHELSLALHVSQAGLNFSTQKYSGM